MLFCLKRHKLGLRLGFLHLCLLDQSLDSLNIGDTGLELPVLLLKNVMDLLLLFNRLGLCDDSLLGTRLDMHYDLHATNVDKDLLDIYLRGLMQVLLILMHEELDKGPNSRAHLVRQLKRDLRRLLV